VDARHPMDDDDWARIWQELADVIAQMTRPPCGACAGSSMCAGCRGYGRILVRDLGSFNCPLCSGDGACTGCDGTGRALHA
jgi:hypothetical protein